MTAFNTPTVKLLAELDCILDTRLGVLLALDAEKVPALLASTYHGRLQDRFEGFDQAAFEAAYKARGESILKNSRVTPMAALMLDFVKKALKQTLRTPFHKNPLVELNVYPYVIDDETADSILSVMAYLTQELCDVAIVSYSPEQLNPLFMSTNYAVAMMYDAPAWMETHAKNGLWAKYSCPDVQVFTPLMVRSAQEFVATDLQVLGNDFDTIVKEASVFVQLQFLPISEFCWVFNPNAIEADKETIPPKEDSPDV